MDKFETLEDYQNSLKEFNERTRKSYEDFIQEYGDDSQKLQLRCTPYTEKKGRYGVASLDFGFQIWQSRQVEVDQLKEAIERQGKLAIQAMNEAHKGSRLELSIAKDIQASLKPELIESEHQMNAQLTDENMKLEARIELALAIVSKMAKATNSTAMWAHDLDKALRGNNANS